MKRRSIIFCINYMHTGGVEKSLLSLIDALPRDAFDIHIALMQHKGELLGSIPADVTVHTLHRVEREKARLGFPLRHARDLGGPLSYLAAKLRGTLIPYYRHILGDARDIARHFESTADAIADLKSRDYTVCALEQVKESIDLRDFRPCGSGRYAIVAGHEVHGVDPTVVDAADVCLEIPQFGTKHSLNVSVSTGIALWHFFTALMPR